MIFRAIWPVVDETVTYADLCRQAAEDLPTLLTRSSARVTGPGRFSIAPADKVPGSGRVSESVLVYEAPAVGLARRDYRRWAA